MKSTTIQTLVEKIEALDNVVSTNRWSKADHDRLYVEVKSQNRFGNDSKIYIDLNTGDVVSDLRKGQSGAKSYGWAVNVDAAVRAIVEMAKIDDATEIESVEDNTDDQINSQVENSDAIYVGQNWMMTGGIISQDKYYRVVSINGKIVVLKDQEGDLIEILRNILVSQGHSEESLHAEIDAVRKKMRRLINDSNTTEAKYRRAEEMEEYLVNKFEDVDRNTMHIKI